jgi:hypothetical protein
MSTAKPSAAALYGAYLQYFSDRSPCGDDRINNQCAVRLSVALVRCGFTIRDQDFEDPRRIHRARSVCGIPEDHVCGAHELEQALVRLWGDGEYYPRRAGATMAAYMMRGRWGIVYFNNCFTRRGSTRARGDHIDLWNGANYMNQLYGIGAGGDASAADSLFSRSGNSGYYVRFMPLQF